MEIDYDTMWIAYKVLFVIFISSTIVANMDYLIRYLREPISIYSAGHLGKISLALGSIFLALFPYVVWFRVVFEKSTKTVSCRTVETAATFQFIFFPFVFAFTIFSTSLTLFLNQRQIFNFNVQHILMSLVIATVPWVLALFMICPLIFSGMNLDDDGCNLDDSLGNIKAALGMGRVLPAIVALLFSIAMNVMTSRISRWPSIPAFNALVENEASTDSIALTSFCNANLPVEDINGSNSFWSIGGSTDRNLGLNAISSLMRHNTA